MPTDNRARTASQNSQQDSHAAFEIRTVQGARSAFTAFLDSERELKSVAATFFKLGGMEESIAQVRAANLQAAEWHRMAQIIGQVSHDMTRRIEEMGQYHF